MPNRPTSITVICWIIIVITLINIPLVIVGLNDPHAIELMKKSPIPMPAQYVLMIAGFTMSIICSIAMLKGKNWGRQVYVGWSIIGLIIGFLTSPAKMMMIPGVIILAIMAFFFYRPAANEFFKAEDAPV